MNKFDKALKRIKKNVIPQKSWTDEDREHYLTIVEALEMAAADPDRVGYWSKKEYPLLGVFYRCSKCGAEVKEIGPYCTVCGKEMRGVKQ